MIAAPEYSQGSWRAQLRFLGKRWRRVLDLTPAHRHDDDGDYDDDDDDTDDDDHDHDHDHDHDDGTSLLQIWI